MGKRCRQKKRWEDNIKEWAGIDFVSSSRAAENRIIWKGIVANSSVVPDDLPRLWDRIEKIEITTCVFHELVYTSFPFVLKDGVWGLSLRKCSSISLPCMSFLS